MTPRKTRRCSRCNRNRAHRFFPSPTAKLCVDCRKWRRHPASRTYQGRAVRLMETYGLTEADYDRLLARQGGRCAGCSGARRYNLHVDHDHKVERDTGDSRKSVRGLLCKRCNGVLSRVGDSPLLLRQLAAYLENPPAKEVLT